MLYDSKMMKSFPQSFAFFPLAPRGRHDAAWRRFPSFTAAFVS